MNLSAHTPRIYTCVDRAVAKASESYILNGIGLVFECGQPDPSFYIAINTTANGLALPSTGEWDYPASGFIGSEVLDSCGDIWQALHEYMLDANDDSRIDDVKDLLTDVVIAIRGNWKDRLTNCSFTVNECNDSDEEIARAFVAING